MTTTVESRIVFRANFATSDASLGAPHPNFLRPHVPVIDTLSALRRGDPSHMVFASVLSNGERVGVGPLRYLTAWLDRTETPRVWVSHDPMNLREKEYMFADIQPQVSATLNTDAPIKPIKTLTIHFPGQIPAVVAVTGLDEVADRAVRIEIAKDLTQSRGGETREEQDKRKVSMTSVKNARVNLQTEDFDISDVFGLKPGAIGPLVEKLSPKLEAWYYVNKRGVDPSTPVELALSLRDSVIMPKEAFEAFMRDYEREFLTNPTFREIQLG